MDIKNGEKIWIKIKNKIIYVKRNRKIYKKIKELKTNKEIERDIGIYYCKYIEGKNEENQDKI